MTAPVQVTYDKNSVTVSWNAPQSTGSSPILRYNLFSKADYESSFTQVYTGLTLSYKVQGLETGFYYQFKVQSVNKIGPSDMSPASLSIITALIPGTPTELQLIARTS
jgi:titin